MTDGNGKSERKEIKDWASVFNKGAFLHVQSGLGIKNPKVVLWGGKFGANRQGSQFVINHYLDLDAALLVVMKMQWGKPVDLKEYKGGIKAGVVTSRICTIKTNEKGVTWINLTQGPGKKTSTGAVLPAFKGNDAPGVKAFGIPLDPGPAQLFGAVVYARICAELAARETLRLMMEG